MQSGSAEPVRVLTSAEGSTLTRFSHRSSLLLALFTHRLRGSARLLHLPAESKRGGDHQDRRLQCEPMIDSTDWIALWTTLKLAAVTTVILLIIGLPLAWWLARTTWRA